MITLVFMDLVSLCIAYGYFCLVPYLLSVLLEVEPECVFRAKQGTGWGRKKTNARGPLLQHMPNSHPPPPLPWLPAHIPSQHGLTFLPGRCRRPKLTVTGSLCPQRSPTKGVPHPRVPAGNQHHLLAGRPYRGLLQARVWGGWPLGVGTHSLPWPSIQAWAHGPDQLSLSLGQNLGKSIILKPFL